MTSARPVPDGRRSVVVGITFMARALTPNDGSVMPTARNGPMLVALPRNRIALNRVAPLRVADLEIDALHPRVRQGAREVRLSPVEHVLLYALAARGGVVVSYREIADMLGQTNGEMRNNAFARHVSSLRRKLKDDAGNPRYIETVPAVGYRLLAARKA